MARKSKATSVETPPEINRVRDLQLDRKNANKGNHRGRAMLENSVRRYGMGRSILLDKKGRVIAGNKTVEAAGYAGVEDVQVVQSDGKRIIAVMRTDLDLEEDVAAKELAIVDNQANAVGLAWNPSNLTALEAEGADVRQFFRAPEWAKLMSPGAGLDEGDEIPEMALQPFEEYNYLMVVCKNSQDWQGLCEAVGVRREKVKLGEVTKIGLGRVIDGAKMLELLKCESSSRPKTAPKSSPKAR